MITNFQEDFLKFKINLDKLNFQTPITENYFINFCHSLDNLIIPEYKDEIKKNQYYVLPNQRSRILFEQNDFNALKETILANILYDNNNKNIVNLSNKLILSKNQDVQNFIIKYFNVFLNIGQYNHNYSKCIFKKTYNKNRSLFDKFIISQKHPLMIENNILYSILNNDDANTLKKFQFLGSNLDYFLIENGNDILHKPNILNFIIEDKQYLLKNFKIGKNGISIECLILLLKTNTFTLIENKTADNFLKLIDNVRDYLKSFANVLEKDKNKQTELNHFLNLFNTSEILDRTFLFESLSSYYKSLIGRESGPFIFELFIQHFKKNNLFTTISSQTIFGLDLLLYSQPNFVDYFIKYKIPVFLGKDNLLSQMKNNDEIAKDIKQLFSESQQELNFSGQNIILSNNQSYFNSDTLGKWNLGEIQSIIYPIITEKNNKKFSQLLVNYEKQLLLDIIDEPLNNKNNNKFKL